MLNHMILTVSDVERSLAFYEAALKPLNIKFFMPYKGEDGHPDLWGFGDGKRAFFWIKQGKPDPAAIHWGFMAEDDERLDVVSLVGNTIGGVVGSAFFLWNGDGGRLVRHHRLQHRTGNRIARPWSGR
jgi:catechol 2,3-dioxygenase-like lactoylglutathione lyase family enzyme